MNATKKFWVSTNDSDCVAVYGTLQDAINYAYDYMTNHYSGFKTTCVVYDNAWKEVHREQW